MKSTDSLTKIEALAELTKLSEQVEFDSDFDESTSLTVLRKLVAEGREALAEAGLPPPVDKEFPKEEPRISRTKTVSKSKGEPADYLRQYQYRKGTVPGSKQSDPQPGSRAEIMKRELLAQSRVETLIPSREGEAKGTPYSITLNGYRLDFPKNTYIAIPRQIAEQIRQANAQLQAAYERIESEHGLERTRDGMRVGDVL